MKFDNLLKLRSSRQDKLPGNFLVHLNGGFWMYYFDLFLSVICQ